MLAPMQGLSNRALRQLFVELVAPDVLFTEFIRVRPGSKKSIKNNDHLEVQVQAGKPLVAQLIGRDNKALIAAATKVQDLGARHININLGCPYGRMTNNSAGGALLKDPIDLPDTLKTLRLVCEGSFSVKVRSGYENPSQIFSLLPIFEDCGVDFIILHPRTVRQCFAGRADHSITAQVVQKTSLPVIANGDIFTAMDGRHVQEQTRAAGLMFGRGAIADPWLFERMRGKRPTRPDVKERQEGTRLYITSLADRYSDMFCGETQVLNKVKAVLSQFREPELLPWVKKMKRAKTLAQLGDILIHPL